MVEPHEEDLEASNSSPPTMAEVSKTDDIDMTVQEINENQEQEDEDDEEDNHEPGVGTKEEIILDNEGVDTIKEKLTHNYVEVLHDQENVISN